MRAELLTIGSELTGGITVNTNAAYVARRLAELGIPCPRQVTVSDDRSLLQIALQDALARGNVIITTGGLGPTFDDITMDLIAQATHRPLIPVSAVAAAIRRFYTRRHRSLQRAALRQALLPGGGTALPNPLGTAPGLWLPLSSHQLLIALPGVPAEMRAIMEQSVLPRLKRRHRGTVIKTRILRTAGVVELSLEAILRRMTMPKILEVGLYPHLRTVDIRLTATGSSRVAVAQALNRIERHLRHELGDTVYGTDEQTLESVIGDLLMRRGATVAVAESCTGGLVADCLTNVSGSSRYVRGAVVAYHNDVKRDLLRVAPPLLRRFGAVSGPVAKAMAEGIRRATEADLGIAVTGIAGPTGGTPTKPVGLVYLGLADGTTVRAQRWQFLGDRTSIKAQATQAVLDWLRRYLLLRT